MNLLLVVGTLAVFLALAVVVIRACSEWVNEDLGYTRDQLEQVERECEARLAEFKAWNSSERYDAKFEQCEESEKFEINPDPFG